LGYIKEELLKMTFGEIDALYELEDVEKYRQFYRQMLGTDLHCFVTAHKHRDGHTIPVEIIAASIKQEGGADVGIAVARNIEKRPADQCLEPKMPAEIPEPAG
jgi:PAS domain S-box-containing protein